ncbi:hypothetical protein PF011_g16245 [Phytophthora fragariae]|uniref:Uncharacterized protein n=2 Tax=Phytophthora fragariae TaxID=53985 RepID=A0A6A3JTW2_9STRA|nr:hypothetical protein PF011_g16245 [Phytophthora fragariae]
MEKPSESATGELTTGSDEETTRTTTVNVCNGARCRCLEALPVVVKHVNNLPSKKAEVNSSVVPVKKRTDSEESDSPVTKTSVPGSSKPEYVQDEAGNAQLASVPEEPSVESEDGTTPSKFNEESDWFKKTLAASAEVKRANRDFSVDSPPTKEGNRPDPGPSGPTEPENANDEDASIMNEVVASIVPSSRFAATTVDERRVIAKIGVSRANLERTDEDVPSALPFRLRTLVRSEVFLVILTRRLRTERAARSATTPMRTLLKPSPVGISFLGLLGRAHDSSSRARHRDRWRTRRQRDAFGLARDLENLPRVGQLDPRQEARAPKDLLV